MYDEITALSDDNYELSKKISSLDINDEDNDENNERVIEHMKEQLSSYADLAGIVEIKGPGIILTIYDGEYDVNKDDQLMTLVTCDTRGNNKRIVILAKLVNIANV